MSSHKQRLTKQAIGTHGSFNAHFEYVADEVQETLKVLRAPCPPQGRETGICQMGVVSLPYPA